MSCTIKIGEWGTRILVTMKECVGKTTTTFDLSSATSLTLKFKGKTGSTKSVPATLTGVDGEMQYITTNGFIDETGMWKVEATATFSDGNYISTITSFTVINGGL